MPRSQGQGVTVNGVQILVTVVGFIFTAGGASILTTIIKGRSEAREIGARTRNIEAKTAGEVDSVAIQGAETAVLTLQAANESLLRTIATQQTQIDRQAAMITTMDHQLETSRNALQTAEMALREARTAQAQAEHSLAEYRNGR